MKRRLILICILASTSIYSQKKKIELTFLFTQQYCGGARPTEEIQKEAERQKPYANKTIIFLSEKGKADSAKTNSDGVLKLKLRKGHYTFFEAWRYNLYTPDNLPIESFDRACLKTEWEKPVYKVAIFRKENKITLLNPINLGCQWNAPCLLETAVPPVRE